MKKLYTALAAMLLVLLAVLVPAKADPAVSWTIDGGTLTLSGSGPMADYPDAADAPWYARRLEITQIVVESGITAIGSNSFTWCKNVTAVSLPAGLTSIGKNAFWGCTALRQIDLPLSLEYMGTCAFFKSGLTSVVIPAGVTTLEQGLFGQCEALKTVIVHDEITVICKDAFSRCYALQELTLPNNLQWIGEHAFFACISLDSLQFSPALETVSSAAFYGCSSLSRLTFTGKAPALAEDAFLGLTATVHYPQQDESWASVTGQSYGGSITWAGNCDHSYTSVFTAPTCVEQGYSTFTCSLCGYSYVGLYVDALGHSFTNYVSDGNATVDCDGTKTARCDRGCGATDTVVDEGSRLPGDITSDLYTVGEETVSTVPIGTTVKEFLSNLHQKSTRIVKDGTPVSGDSPVGTGMVVQLLSGDRVVGGWVIIVTGDINGDGTVSVTDMLAVKGHLLQKSQLTGIAAQAADTNGDHGISITDFLQIKAHLLNISQIKPQ